MKRWTVRAFALSFAALMALVLGACGSGNGEGKSEGKNEATSGETARITYESETGPIEVPAHPKRVVVLGGYTGNVLALGVPLVGVDSWSKDNPHFQRQLEGVKEISEENVEGILALEPDLILGMSTAKNLDKLRKIAPTVAFTYNKVDYLTQHVEIGKVLNKEREAQAWVDDFRKRAQRAGEAIRAKIGEQATVSVIENFEKQLYVFGDNWGRGTEILYGEMKLKMPKKVKESALASGYYALSAEVLPEFAGDYIIFSKNKDGNSSFQQTETYQRIPAVKNGRVFEVDSKGFFFNDPLTLDYQLDFFRDKFGVKEA